MMCIHSPGFDATTASPAAAASPAGNLLIYYVYIYLYLIL